jgi:SNF2 family DNA or RNA helicase
MTVAVYHGADRDRLTSALQSQDLVLTTYETLVSEWRTGGALCSNKWHRIVLDEGQQQGPGSRCRLPLTRF